MPSAENTAVSTESAWLASQFDQRRDPLRAVAYRLLGSLADVEDALQEAWLRLNRTNADEIDNLDAWLTTVVARISLNMLRSRERRREEAFGIHVPDPVVSADDRLDPAAEVLLGDSVGLALLVVIEALTPPERLAFVLHDVFAVSFEEIAGVLDRSPAAARQLASRARRRVHRSTQVPDGDLAAQQEVVRAFFTAAREGDFDRLIELLDPDVVLVTDGPPHAPRRLRGVGAVGRAALFGARSRRTLREVLVNRAPGAVILEHRMLVAVVGFTVAAGRIVELDAITDPDRLRTLDLRKLVEHA